MQGTLVEVDGQYKVSESAPSRQLIGAVIVGNGLTWFDYISYSFLADVIARLFFPSSNEVSSLLLTFGTIGIGFCVRPLGGVWLGAYADRVGRKSALTITIALMTTGTAIIALAPTYDQIGIAAPALIVFARLLQGISAGGKMGSTASLLIERTPASRQNYYTSWIQASVGLSILLSASLGFYLTTELDPSVLNNWGWRVPFWVGLLLGPIGFYIHCRMGESVQVASARRQAPFREVLCLHPRATLTGTGLTALWSTCSYVLMFYIPTYAATALHLPVSTGFCAMLAGGTVLLFVTPVMGALADRFGARPFLVGGSVMIFALAYPMFAFINERPGIFSLLIFQVVFGISMACYEGPVLAVLSNLFPARVRSSGIAVSYNVGVILFGGFAAAILTWLMAATKSNLAPAYYVMVAALISALAGIFYRENDPASN